MILIMKSRIYPLAVRKDFLDQVRRAAKITGLSMADVIRQSAQRGLPGLVQDLSPSPLKGLKPFTAEEARRCYEEPNPEFDALEHHCASLPVPPPEDD
jgi:hypothetical protein